VSVTEVTSYSESPDFLLVSPDGTLLAAPFDSDQIRLWDLSTGRLQATIREQNPPRSRHWSGCLAISPDGKALATLGWGPKVWLWDISSQKLQSELIVKANAASGDWPFAVAFAPDGKTLATASQDATVRFWDLKTQSTMQTIQPDTFARRIVFSPDGARVALLGSPKRQGNVRAEFWDVGSGQLKTTLESPKWSGSAVSRDLTILAVKTHDATIELWDVAAGQRLHTLYGCSSQRPDTMAFSADGKSLAAISWSPDYDLFICNVDAGQWRGVISTEKDTKHVALAPDGKTVAVLGSDDSICLWDTTTLRRTATIWEGDRGWKRTGTWKKPGMDEASAPPAVRKKLEEVRTTAQKITLGMRRSEVEKTFRVKDGGLGGFAERYCVHPQVKVDIVYDRTGGADRAQNKVISVPRVYRDDMHFD
jgi:WD40 repeat protein